MTRALTTVALLALAGAAASAQNAPAEVTWEPLGPLVATAMVVLPGPTGDTLAARGSIYDPYTPTNRRSGIFRLAPGDTAWVADVVPGGLLSTYGPFDFLRVSTGTLLGYASSGPTQIDRRDGETYAWTRLNEANDGVPSVYVVYERPSDGALIAGTRHPSEFGGLLISTDDGRTWGYLGDAPPGADDRDTFPSIVHALAEVRLTSGAPRMVAGVQNGLAFSDDGGASWTRSNVWGPFRYWGNGFAVVPGAAGDTVYAAVRDFGLGYPVVFASSDGGATWEERHRFPVMSAFAEIVASPDGALYVGIGRDRAQEGDHVIQRSTDGGRTWAGYDAGHDGQGVNQMKLDTSGRLLVTGGSGVWRTAVPVYATAEMPAPEVSAVLAVRVFPNPTGGAVAVALALAASERVTVHVYDVQGREVAVVHDGAASDGQRFVVPAGLAPGAYIVRAVTASGARASAGLTVVR